MNWQGWAEIALVIGLAIGLGWPLGVYMSRVWNRERTWLDPVLRPVESDRATGPVGPLPGQRADLDLHGRQQPDQRGRRPLPGA